MSDNLRWFKVWNSILTDPDFLSLSLDKIGTWVLLGALISLHGDNGKITISKTALNQLLRIPNDNANDNAMILPNVDFIPHETDNGIVTVIIKKWSKYQLDSTGYERLKRYRAKQHDNGLREDKDKTKKRTPIAPKKSSTDFDMFYSLYPRKVNKPGALKAWQKINPENGTFEQILSSLEKWKSSEQWTKDGGQFIPHPATWLNQRRWEDTPAQRAGGESWR